MNKSNRNQTAPEHSILNLKRIGMLLFVAALLAIGSIGCHTAHGFGEDMTDAGHDIQRNTR